VTLNNLARAYQAAGQLDRAVPLFEQALAGLKAKPGPDHPDTLTTLNNLALAYLAAKQPEKALPLLRAFLAGQKKQLGGDNPRLAGLQATAAQDLLTYGQPAEAETVLRECLAIRARKEPDAWTTPQTKSLLGASLLGQKKYADAEPFLLQGYEGLKQRGAKI